MFPSEQRGSARSAADDSGEAVRSETIHDRLRLNAGDSDSQAEICERIVRASASSPAANGDPKLDTSIVYFAPGLEGAAAKLAASVEIVEVAPMPGVLPVEGGPETSRESIDLLVVLGTDRDEAGGSSG